MDKYLARAILEKRRKNKELPFPEQEAFVNDPAQFIAAQCTRRAGKTNALALRFKRIMDRYPNSLCRYIAHTRDSAKDIMWPVLQEMNQRYNWGATLTESNLTMVIPNGARLRLFGADMKNFILRLKGAKSPAVAIDEAQDFGPHIGTLVDDVLTPTIADYEGSWLALTGTPGPVPRGTFYEATEKGIGNYSVHRWEVYDNPYMPNARAFVDELKRKKGWDDRNPTFLREWCNQWVLDYDSLLIQYNEQRCHFEEMPRGHYKYILGIDIGFNDSDALAVLAWSETSRTIYLVEEQTTSNQDITSLSEAIEGCCRRYDIAKIVMDTGGLGLKIAEELRRRRQIPVYPADKARKMENVAFLNDYLRLGRFKAKKESQFVSDSYQVQVDIDKTTPDKIIVKKGFHSDIIDAVLYAFKESPAWAYQEPVIPPKIGSPEWAQKEVDDMEQKAVEHFESLESSEKGFGIWT